MIKNNNSYTKYLSDDNLTSNKQFSSVVGTRINRSYKLLFRLGLHQYINRKITEPEYIPYPFRYTDLIICSSAIIKICQIKWGILIVV